MDKRHERRIKIVQNLYAKSFQGEAHITYPNMEEKEVSDSILANKESLDEHISTNAPKYPLDKIAKIDLSILRLALYELLISKQEPVKVVINEAVELAKEMGNERSYAFINAVLGSILKTIQPAEEV